MREATQARHHRLALEWWSQSATEQGIPFHAVAAGLRVNYTTLRTLLRERGIIAGKVDESYVQVDEAHNLLQERTGGA
jgi:hypothetical protein